MSETVFIDLAAADDLLLDYAKVRSTLDRVRSSLATPWNDGVAQVGFVGRSAPSLLRTIDDLLNTARADVAWRVEFIRARESSPLDAGRIETTIPERDSVLRVISTRHLIEALLVADDPQRIQMVLEELAIRGSGNHGLAVTVLDALGREGVERLLAMIIANAPGINPERSLAPFGHDFEPAIDNPIDPDDLLIPLDLLVSFAVAEQPALAGELLVGDHPQDVLRSAMLLHWGDFSSTVLAEVFVALEPLLADGEDFRWQYSNLLHDIDPSPLQSTPWIAKFANPMLDLLGEVALDPAAAAEFVTFGGVIELLSRPPAVVLEVGGRPFVEIWDQRVGAILTGLLATIGELANRVPDSAIAGRAIDELAAILDSSYGVLVGLRDTVAGGFLVSDDAKSVAALLAALHFDRIGPAEWPLDGHAKDFFGWIASSPAAVQTLVGGLAVFYESMIPGLVANFVDPASLGEASIDRSVLQLEPMAFILSLVALGLEKAELQQNDVVVLELIFDFAWNEAIGKIPFAKVGSNAAGRIVKLVLDLGIDSLHDRAVDLLPPTNSNNGRSIESILTDFFIPHETLPLASGGETQAIVPLQISLFNQVLQFAPEAMAELPELAPYLLDGSINPPAVGTDEYARFALAFNQVQRRDVDAVVAYLTIWSAMSDWAHRSIDEVRTITTD